MGIVAPSTRSITMAGIQVEQQDVALEALETLAEVTSSGIDGLNDVNEQLSHAQRQRRMGWTWHRIVANTDLADSLSAMARITAELARASGEFRRSLVHVLRGEGIAISEIGHFFAVSRQRVSTLLRPRPSE
jgi:hypothetical protein